MKVMPNKISPKLYTLSAVGIGFFLMDETSSNEQNALGNWLMLIAQVLCTNAYFLQLKNERENTDISDSDTIAMMKKMIDAINKELENIKNI